MVSTEGRVKRLSRKIPGKAKVTQLKYEKCLNERILTPQHDKCRLCPLQIKTPRWECLVMETDINQFGLTFLGYDRKNTQNLVLDHLNSIKDDNRLQNLQIVSQSQNKKRYFKTDKRNRDP